MQDKTSETLLPGVERLMSELTTFSNGEASRAASDHLESGGKRVRARLALNASTSLGLSPIKSIAIAAACELIHNAPLIHDDIHDKSETRRGKAATWARFGSGTAICAGDLLISAAYAAIARTQSASMPQLLTQTHRRVAEVISGQCEDLLAQSTDSLSLDLYETIAKSKSAPLLALPVELALIEAGHQQASEQVGYAADAFALAYQIADDIEDISNDIIQGQPNIISVLGGQDASSSQGEQARQIAVENYRLAARLADQLPRGSGSLLSAYARKGLATILPVGEAA